MENDNSQQEAMTTPGLKRDGDEKLCKNRVLRHLRPKVRVYHIQKLASYLSLLKGTRFGTDTI